MDKNLDGDNPNKKQSWSSSKIEVFVLSEADYDVESGEFKPAHWEEINTLKGIEIVSDMIKNHKK